MPYSLTESESTNFRSRTPRRTPAVETCIPKLSYRSSVQTPTIKVGIFARLHGDEAAGTQAAYDLIRWAWHDPEELRDFELHVYPICNPTGTRLATRHSASGLDLNREFWSGSLASEVIFLENELRQERFHIIISLHADDDSDGVYGFVSGDVLSEPVLKAALNAAAEHVPINRDHLIDGFLAYDGVIRECYQGILNAPPEQQPRPIEIVFETPNLAALNDQALAHVAAVKAILAEYRRLLAYAPNL